VAKKEQKSAEPKVGISEPRMVKKESKIKAFFDVLVPTEFGEMRIRNFRIVDAGKGLFVSLPNRATKVNGKTKYYNDIRFQKVVEYRGFLEEVSRVAIPAVEARMEKAKATV